MNESQSLWTAYCIYIRLLVFRLSEIRMQGLQIRQIWRILRQNCSGDSTEVMERVTSTPEIFVNKQFCP